MKTQAISKINKIGKFNYIVVIIAKCMVIVSLVVAVISGLVFIICLGYNLVMDFVLHQKGHIYESF